MDLDEKMLSSELLYEGRILSLFRDSVRLPDGGVAGREVVRHRGAAAVMPVTGDGQVLLVRQYRYPAGEVMLEIPAGKLDAGETPEHCAARELREETGAEGRLRELGLIYPTPGYSDEIIYLFAADKLSFGQAAPDSDEFVETVPVPLPRLLEMCADGRISDGKTLATVLRYTLAVQD